MKQLLIISLFLAVSLFGNAQELTSYRLEVQDFKELKVTDGINVDYVCSADSAGWIAFECDPSIASSILLTNNKSCLHIQIAIEAVEMASLPTLRVYSSSLTKVENSADSTIRILSDVPVESFTAKVIGNGTIVVRDIETLSLSGSINTGKGHLVFNGGSAQKAKFRNVGTGPLEAGLLKADQVKVIALGTGPVDCWAVKTLSVYGAGSSTIYYRGNPEKIVNRTIGVKLVEID